MMTDNWHTISGACPCGTCYDALQEAAAFFWAAQLSQTELAREYAKIKGTDLKPSDQEAKVGPSKSPSQGDTT